MKILRLPVLPLLGISALDVVFVPLELSVVDITTTITVYC